ncbi:DUF5672 family protein [uncultured Desulfovibrio sp.]|uniref:DUF5672 family protein n=1 Tax=uncultured Desulfovibrio sp. TaxID=167968 RepID=UPI0028042FDE|nr:DUF5672 family protein [uncultured Desulfovibrio sp.]
MIPAISVIIPVYNGKRYLRECLDYVCRQTLQNLEIICVDDGSTDASLEILNSYAANDQRIHIYSLPENGGAAAARNLGMSRASGEYLGFVDCDDYPCLDFYEKLWRGTCGSVYDVVKGNYRYWLENGRSVAVDYSMNEEILKHRTSFSFAFASAIYRRETLLKNHIFFPENQRDMEDPIFALRFALICNNINIIESAEINIRINKYSSTYGSPSVEGIEMKFNGLSKMINRLNSCDNIPAESYSFILSFWINNILQISLRNKTDIAFRLIVDCLWITYKMIKINYWNIQYNKIQLVERLFHSYESKSEIAILKCLEGYYSKKLLLSTLSLRLKYTPSAKFEACIAIPIYKRSLSFSEIESFKQCIKVLGKYNIILFCPENMNISFYENIASKYDICYNVLRFPDMYFSSTCAYSRLMLNPYFYKCFSEYKYLLVYQLDSWVFRDELGYWCSQNYDYIGAPWFEGYASNISDRLIEPSGNGGFSLRKVSKFIKCTNLLQRKLIEGKKEFDYNGLQNEDGIIINLFQKVDVEFNIAPTKIAMQFSFEVNPELLFRICKKLPFGCHAFLKYGYEFWRSHINGMNKMRIEEETNMKSEYDERGISPNFLRSRFVLKKKQR